MIGILGGMGPEASLDLHRKILSETLANKDQDHLPVIHVSCPGQIPDRSGFLLRNEGPNPAMALAGMVQHMARMGVQVVGMPCHTAHAPAIFEALVAQLVPMKPALRLLNMVEVTLEAIAQQFETGSRIGILSTSGTYQTKMYPDALTRAGFQAIILSESDQDSLVQQAIYDPEKGIKAGGSLRDDWSRHCLTQAVEILRNDGAEAVILACTELPLVLAECSELGLAMIDPTRLLARALIRAVAPQKLRPA